MKENRKRPKQRILEAAISLFARKGYAATAVREIAKTADVNVSMISYYFDGKVSILKAIVNEFHNRYYQVIKEAHDESIQPEECLRLIVRSIVNFVRKNTELTMAAYHALPLDIPEIADLKVERVAELTKGVSGIMRRLGLDPNDAVQVIIIAPALLGIILTHFRFRLVQKQLYDIEFNDAFYERYTETLATLFLRGITGIAAQTKKMKGDKSENNS